MKKRNEWLKKTTPTKSENKEEQEALDWWNKLPIQNLKNMKDSWVGYLWKYFPEEEHPYHLTTEQVLHIYNSEKEKKK